MLTAQGCYSENEEGEIEIAHYRSPCVGEGLRLCLMSWESQKEQWTFLYGGIAGFEPQWGHNYRLSITVEQVSKPAAGASSQKWSLNEVLEDTVVEPGTTFPYPVKPTLANKGYGLSIQYDAAAEGGTLLDGKGFVCNSAEICQQIEARLLSVTDFRIVFQHADDVTDPLWAISIEDSEE